jgi:hypothetical protein
MSAISSSRSLLGLFLVFLATQAATEDAANWRPNRPIMLRQSGGFTIGGKIIQNPLNPNMTLS